MSVIQEVLMFTREYVNNAKYRTRENKDKIRAAYRQITGESLTTNCGTCLIEALFKIKKMMEKKPCKYLLKPGALLQAFGDESKTATNANLTDELAQWHLKNNPGTKILFSKMPVIEILPATKVDEVVSSDEPKEVVKRTRKKKS